MRSFVHWAVSLTAAVALSLVLPQAAAAQGGGTVRGRVLDASNQQPLSDVQISIGGTGRGGATGGNGEFVITNVPVGERTITARRIGYSPVTQPVTVAATGETRVDLTMNVTATELDKVVVTGTVLGAEKRTLGNSVTSVDVAEVVMKAPVMNISEVLQGKSPGVTLLPGSGTPGTAGEIRIRGLGSVSGYKPVIYVDGIRYNAEPTGNFSAGGFGVSATSLALASQVTSALDFLSPNDIESIEILKGPSATTLYGADAANGVIQIITKKGTRGQQSLRWTARFDRGTAEWTLPIPDNYTTCDSLRIAQVDASGPTWPGCTNKQRWTVLVDNPIERDSRAIRTGDIQRTALSMTGGGDQYSFYVGGDRDTEQGIMHNSFNNRWSARGNFTFNPSEKVGFSVLMNFIRTDLRLPLGDESSASVMFTGLRGQPGRRPSSVTTDSGWNTFDPSTSNAYNNRTKSDRLTLGGTVTYDPFRWFRNRITIGIDNTLAQAALLYLPGDEGEPGGATLGRTPITRIFSIDYGGSIPWDITPEVELVSSFGTQIVANRTETLAATGSGLGSPDVILIGSATTTSGSNAFTESNSVGYFLNEQIGWNNRLFLTGALRADDHSAFGSNFDWIIYPKLSLSWVLSEEPVLQEFMDIGRIGTLKLRSAWGRAGRSPPPYSATQTYTVDRVSLGGSTGSALRISAYGNPNLKAERGEELEVGFDAGLLDDRLGVDFTWYDKKTTDMLASIATAPSSGFPVNRFTNLGTVTNSGVELGITGTPVRREEIEWDTRVSYSTNKNRLEDFGVDGKTRESVTSGLQAYAVVQEHREGYPLAGYWAAKHQTNPDGTPLLNTSGAVIFDTASYVGPSSPTREVGFSNTLTLFRNWRVYALLDYKGGFYLFNQKERNRCQSGVDNCARVNDPRVRNPQTASDSLLAKNLVLWRSSTREYIEKADFTKLREVSVTYTVPRSLLSRLGRSGPSGASISFSGRNLALWSDYSGIDPETNSYGGRNFLRVDAWATPNPRRFVGSVNLIF